MAARVVSPDPAPGENWYHDDPVLAALLTHYVPTELLAAAEKRLDRLGAVAPGELHGLARTADKHRPTLPEDGGTADDVDYHESYLALRRAAREHRAFTASWHALDGRTNAPRTVHFALGYLYAQAEQGYYCPACMTDGAAFVLARHSMAADLVDRLVQDDPEGAYEGAMFLTEKGGGSDVGGGTETAATRADDGSWRLTGLKWFASNCTADVALALARLPDGAPGTDGLGLFVVRARLDDGSPNPGVRIERLKDKLGTASMATGEVRLDQAHAELVRGAGDGFKAMAEMVNLSRLYNAFASVAVVRRALRESTRAGNEREVFGKGLSDQPLFLADVTRLAVEHAGALAFVMDTADVFGRYEAGDESARPLLRVLTPAAKSVTARLAVSAASRACELVGGVGYTEEYVTARLLRDAQVLPIWEGTSNIQALDLLRGLFREEGLAAYSAHVGEVLDASRGRDATATPRARAAGSLKAFADEANTMAEAGGVTLELAAPGLLEQVFHVHATALLCRLEATATEVEHLASLADLYAALYLAPERAVGEQALAAWVARRLEPADD